MRTIHNNRESWLGALTRLLAPRFEEAGHPLPDNIRFAIGFTSAGRRGSRVAEVWDHRASRDGHFEIFIKPDTDDPLAVAKSLCHELAHAAVGLKAGHRGPFRAVMKSFGFQAPFTSSRAKPAPEFEELFASLLPQLGALPHGALGEMAEDEATTSAPKGQRNRQLKCECQTCGYTARTTRKWLAESGPPLCPCNAQPMAYEAPQDPEEPQDGAGDPPDLDEGEPD